MPPPLPDDEREAIAHAIREGRSRNDIARQFGRSLGIVSKIAATCGLTFDRSRIEAASRARAADVEAARVDLTLRRAELARLLLEDAYRLREALWQPALAYNFGGRDNTYEEHTLTEPGFRDKQAILASVKIAIEKSADLEESTRSVSRDTALAAYMAQVRAAYVATAESGPGAEHR